MTNIEDRRMGGRGRGARVAGGLAALGVACSAWGQSYWVAPVSGEFHDRARWSGGVPDGHIEAIFGATPSDTPYDVTFDSDAISEALRVNSNRPTFRLNGYAYQVGTARTGATLKSAYTPSMAIEGGVFRATTLAIASGPLQKGEVTISGEETIVSAPNLAFAGRESRSFLRVLDGATLESRFAGTFGGEDSVSTVEIGGSASMISTSNEPTGVRIVGISNQFSMSVHSGGRFILPAGSQFAAGDAMGSIIDINVTGNGSVFDAGGSLNLGRRGTTRFEASDGAFVRAQQVIIASIGEGHTSVVITGAETRLQVASFLTVGDQPAGNLGVFDGARILMDTSAPVGIQRMGVLAGNSIIEGSVSNSGTIEVRGNESEPAPGTLTILGSLTLHSASVVRLVVGGEAAGSQHSQIVVGSHAALDGRLELVPAPGFTFQPGQSFEIVRYQIRGGPGFSSVVAPGVRVAGSFGPRSLTIRVLCPADWNSDGVNNSADFFDFLSAFFRSDADFNGDGVTNSQDFFDFLTAFFEPCED